MRLTPDVAMIGGGVFGFDLSSPFDCNVYLIDGGDDLAIVDAGAGDQMGKTDLIIENAKKDGFDLTRASKLLLTHYHVDHMGGAAELAERLGLEIHASPLVARTLSEGDEDAMSLPAVKRIGFVPEEFRLKTYPPAGDLVEGAKFKIGRLSVTVYETPGHAKGHVSFLIEGGESTMLVQGDVVFAGGTILLQNIPECSIAEYSASTKKLDSLDFEIFLPGHLGFSLRNGKRHISAAAEQFEKLMVPRNVI